MRIHTLVLAAVGISCGGGQMRSQVSGPHRRHRGYKGRPRESAERFAIHDAISSSRGTKGDAR